MSVDEDGYYDFDDGRICSYPCHVCGETDDEDDE